MATRVGARRVFLPQHVSASTYRSVKIYLQTGCSMSEKINFLGSFYCACVCVCVCVWAKSLRVNIGGREVKARQQEVRHEVLRHCLDRLVVIEDYSS
jgi:hypothetical protein